MSLKISIAIKNPNHETEVVRKPFYDHSAPEWKQENRPFARIKTIIREERHRRQRIKMGIDKKFA